MAEKIPKGTIKKSKKTMRFTCVVYTKCCKCVYEKWRNHMSLSKTRYQQKYKANEYSNEQ